MLRKIKQNKIILIVLFTFVSSYSRIWAIDTVSTGFKVNAGAAVNIDAHGTCSIITNNRSEAIFVPTQTSSEWSTFLGNLPNNVVTSECCNGSTNTFNYTGNQQSIVVPAGCTQAIITAYGAQGGVSCGGLGGQATGTVTVSSGETLFVYVGGGGGYNCEGGYNGGGCGRGRGGGASDVRHGGTDFSNRIIVGGGGGGHGEENGCHDGGSGGGLTGGRGSSGGYGGTQSAGGSHGGGGNQQGTNGSLGLGGSGSGNSGGGGGGYYGGGGGDDDSAGGDQSHGGGGGSSYVTGTNTTTTSGVRSGNGQVIITFE